MNDLTEKGFWFYKNAIRVDTLAQALLSLEQCEDLNDAKSKLRMMHDSYALASWPGWKDESTDHLL